VDAEIRIKTEIYTDHDTQREDYYLASLEMLADTH
jgi:hypothetical protein